MYKITVVQGQSVAPRSALKQVHADGEDVLSARTMGLNVWTHVVASRCAAFH